MALPPLPEFVNAIPTVLQQSLQQQALLWIPLAAFAGGVLSSLLPCSVSFLPLTVAYMGGTASQGTHRGVQWWVHAASFVLGLCLALTALGLAAALLGISLGTAITGWGSVAMGAVALVMGGSMLGWYHLPMPGLFSRMPASTGGVLGAVTMGFVFGLTASPCGTPVLSVLLAYTAKTQDPVLGGLGLFSYALGQSTLLLVAGLGAAVLKHRANLLQVGQWLSRLSGFILLGIGAVWLWQGFSAVFA
jgi:cytochrome c-type biogenesis protein